MVDFREENDSMGTVLVPKDAYYGAQTQRAIDNFKISTLRFPPVFYKSIGLIKKHAAITNRDLGLIDNGIAESIIEASEQVIRGDFDDQFTIDVFQTGSGTSTNMNVNEVIAGRANEIITGEKGGKSPVHPNDHVNKGQSSNDVIPSAIHIASVIEINDKLLPAMKNLITRLNEKTDEFKDIRKTARTHLQDAVPISLGQEFSGYARQVQLNMERIDDVQKRLNELALGGTAVGTGVNSHHQFAKNVIEGISTDTGFEFREAANHFEAQASKDSIVELSGILKTFATGLIKMANDIRWLSSGPRCGLGEINIPELQPGSSIMPGKVNPVIPEVVLQAAARVIGNDAAITYCGQSGNFELNVMMPLMAYDILQSIELLVSASTAFSDRCIKGITPNKDKCESNLEKSLSLATALVPETGYDNAAEIAKQAYRSGKTIRETVKEEKTISNEKADELLDEMIRGD
ncbi:class II fumarate hydratase [Thermodesulfobacteriota bacterium]